MSFTQLTENYAKHDLSIKKTNPKRFVWCLVPFRAFTIMGLNRGSPRTSVKRIRLLFVYQRWSTRPRESPTCLIIAFVFVFFVYFTSYIWRRLPNTLVNDNDGTVFMHFMWGRCICIYVRALYLYICICMKGFGALLQKTICSFHSWCCKYKYKYK